MQVGILLILLLTTSVVIGQNHPASELPRFEDYAVREKWGGTAAPVKFQGPSDREFRTQFIHASKQPPNFAGHYRVATWGCGTDCLEGGIVDLSTGQLLPLPHSRNWPGKWGLGGFVTGGEFDQAVQVRPTSRLLIVNCSDAYRNGGTYLRTSYFVFENGKFRQIAEHVGQDRVF